MLEFFRSHEFRVENLGSSGSLIAVSRDGCEVFMPLNSDSLINYPKAAKVTVLVTSVQTLDPSIIQKFRCVFDVSNRRLYGEANLLTEALRTHFFSQGV